LLNDRLDQALGRVGESFSPLLPHVSYRVSAVLAEPISALRGWDYRWGAESVPTSLAIY